MNHFPWTYGRINVIVPGIGETLSTDTMSSSGPLCSGKMNSAWMDLVKGCLDDQGNGECILFKNEGGHHCQIYQEGKNQGGRRAV